jgi:hypothetical protein
VTGLKEIQNVERVEGVMGLEEVNEVQAVEGVNMG